MVTEEAVAGYRQQLERHRETYLNYRRVCIDNGDHHGVQDASSDLREIEAKIEVLKWVLS